VFASLPAATRLDPVTRASDRPSKLARQASFALVTFAGLTALSLAAWFARTPEPWGWHALVALLSVALGLAAATALFRAPSRTRAAAGAGVMLFSLVRIGVPDHLAWPLILLPLVTFLLMVPVVRAALALD
jgi:hypothetical protein